MAAETYAPQLKRLTTLLTQALTAARRTRQSIEQEMGLSNGYLSKILLGSVELRVEHVLMICDALEIAPAELLHVAFPQESRAAGRRILERLAENLGEPTANDKADRELDERVRRSLARLLGIDPGDRPHREADFGGKEQPEEL